MSDFPAIYRNAAGDRMIVPNMVSSPIGYYRDTMSVEEYEQLMAPPAEFKADDPRDLDPLAAAANAFKQEPKMDPVELDELANDADDDDAADAIAAFGRGN